MKNLFLIAVLLVIFISSLNGSIDNIYNITNGRMVLDYDEYKGSVFKYENRLYIDNIYKIEEFEILSNGHLERLSYQETKYSYESYLDNDRIYSVSRIDTNKSIMTVFDISQPFFKRIVSFEVNIHFSGLMISEKHLLVSDFNGARTILINKETFEIEDYITDFYGWGMVISESVMIAPFSDGVSTFLRFYQVDIENNYERELKSEMILPNKFLSAEPEIQNGKYVASFIEGAVVIDIDDLTNPTILYEIDSDFWVNYTLYTEDKLFLSTDKGFGSLLIYSLDGFGGVVMIHEENHGYPEILNKNIYYDQPYLYMNQGTGLRVYDVSDNFSEIFSHGKYRVSGTFSHTNNDLLYIYFDEVFIQNNNATQSKNIVYSAFDGEQKYVFLHDGIFLLDNLYIENNMLYLAGNLFDLNLNAYHIFEIYQIDDQQPKLIKSSIVKNGIGWFQMEKSRVSFYYDRLSQTDIYYLDGYELEYIGQLQGVVGFNENQDLIMNVNNGIFYIREMDDLNKVIFSKVLTSGFNTIRIVDEHTFLSGNSQQTGVFHFNIEDDFFNRLHIFTQTDRAAINTFNQIITENGYYTSMSHYYSIINGQMFNIGEKDDSHRQVQFTYFFPERKQMIQYAASGIWVYDFDYTVSEGEDIDLSLARSELLGNYPNPFNPETTIRFNVGNAFIRSESIHISIDIYNIRGQKVRSLLDGLYESGSHTVVWDGKDDNGQELGSGVYLYRMVAGEERSVRRMVLLK